jgi:hypothetical protein
MNASVVRVGYGRGFKVTSTNLGVLIITAAHCLPRFPQPHPAAYLEERTYPNILGPLGGTLNVWAELLFADPIADIAVLGPPDGQSLSE